MCKNLNIISQDCPLRLLIKSKSVVDNVEKSPSWMTLWLWMNYPFNYVHARQLDTKYLFQIFIDDLIKTDACIINIYTHNVQVTI